MSHTQSTASLEWTCVEKKPPKNVIVKSSSIFKQNHQKSSLEIEADRNYNDQKRIDNEVLLTGFGSQPGKDKWLELVKKTGVDADKVENHSCFQGQSGKFFITIGFKNKASQLAFTEGIKKDESKRVFAHNRLTKFNSSAEKELRELRNSGAIYGYKLDGFLYLAKHSKDSSWTLIDTQQALKKFTTEATKTRTSNDTTDRRINVQNQQHLDLQVCIQGFTSKPQKVNELVTKFMNRFGLSFEDAFSYSTKNTKDFQGNSKWTILIQLTENSIMRKILTSKPNKIRLSYLMGYTAGDLVDPMLTWKRALTEFNEDVNVELTVAYRTRKIHKFEFADHRFRVKADQSSPWTAIECNNDLDAILKSKRQQTQQKRKSSLYKVNSVESISTSMSVMSVSSGSRM